jgi:hypothetical protein
VRQSQRRNEMRMSRWIPSERNRRQDLPRHWRMCITRRRNSTLVSFNWRILSQHTWLLPVHLSGRIPVYWHRLHRFLKKI